jgi:hypothetical protein
MSGWRQGKIDIKCSIDILQDLLHTVMPEWKNRLSVDPSGALKIDRGAYGGETNCHIIVKPDGYRRPIGFTQNADGKWTIHTMDYGTYNLENNLKLEFATRKVKEQVKERGARIVVSEEGKGQRKMKIHVPVGPKYKLLA